MERELHAGARVKGWAAQWDAWRAGWPHRSRVERWTMWLLAAFVVALLGKVLGIARGLDTFVLDLGGVALLPLLLILLYRWFSWRVLWKVRNRLILTYLLMGLAPVVLVGTLVGIAAYVLAGQYATDRASEKVGQALYQVRDRAGSAAIFGPASTAGFDAGPAQAGAARTAGDDVGAGGLGDGTSLAELRGGGWVPVMQAKGDTGALTAGSAPGWLKPGFRGIVEQGGHLYLCSEVSGPRGAQTVVMLASRPLTPEELAAMGKGLGQLTLAEVPGPLTLAQVRERRQHDEDSGDVERGRRELRKSTFEAVTGGTLEKSKHFYDLPVVFTAPMVVTSWETGDVVPSMVTVRTRTRLLYAQLFAMAVDTGTVVQWALIGIAAFFALLELAALLMAASLSRTITRSIADLYEGTRAVDAGDLKHRIPVRRRDQLSALAGSFNGMAASVQELLERQRESERLQHELEIAQEVQTTLFPQTPTFLGALEMHGACMAARTVGGDYFDFVFGEGVAAGSVLLALGDISGKGISAALLMSALQSAVRAFSVGVAEAEELPPSPSMLLKLLNEHLFRSTQAARYATLFLAVYEAGSGTLTYANGGHLPPLLISADGTVRRLDVGGTVVGLLEFVAYDEATVQMEKGDLLVAFTDGLTEPEREDEDFGEERLLTFTRERIDVPLTVLGMDLLHEVKGWIGQQEQPDDMTVVLARVR